MKNIFKYSLVVAVLGATTLGSYQINDNSFRVGTLFLENVEALAQTEQPDVNNCKGPAKTDCIALHPTNPALDKVVKNARWTN